MQKVRADSIFDSFFQYNIDLLCVTDKNGNFFKVNPEWEKSLGYGILDLDGKSFLDFVHPSDILETTAALNNLSENNVVSDFVNRYRHKDGSYHRLEWRSFIQDNKIYTSAHDITKLQTTKEELHHVSNVYQTVVDTVTVGLALVKNARFEWANDALLKMFKCTLDEFKGQSINLFYKNNKDIDWIKTESYASFENGETYSFEVEVTNKDNSIDWVYSTGRMLNPGHIEDGSVWMIQDISQQKAIVAELNQNAEQIEGIAQNLPGIIFQFYYDENKKIGLNYLNGRTNQYLHLNNKDTDTYFDRFAARLPKDELPDFLSSVNNAIETKSDWYWEGSFNLPDGTQKILEGRSHPRMQNNQLVFDGFILDITSAKESEKAMAQSEAILKSTLQSIENAIIIVSAKNEVLYYNESFIRLFNYPEELFTTMDGDDLLSFATKQFQDPDTAIKIIKEIYTNNIPVNDTIYIVDGRIIERQFFPLVEESPVQGGVWLFKDITLEKHAEEEIRLARERAEESEQRFKALHNASFGGIIIHEHGKILDCNEGVSDIFGFSREELIGNNALMLAADDWKNIVQNSFAKGSEKPYEVFGKRKNKQVFPARIEARNMPYKGKEVRVAEIRDITDQKQHEEELKRAKEHAEESEYFLQESQRVGKVGSYKVDFSTGLMISSSAIHTIFGTDESHDNTINGWLEIIHPDDKGKMIDYYREQVIGKQQPFDKEYRIIRKNNKKTRWVHGLGNLYFDSQGNLSHMLGTITDITERKLIEEERRMMNLNLEKKVVERTNQLQQANKDLESFAYSVSHDLRAPLRHINGFVHLLEKAVQPAGEKAQIYLDRIYQSSKNMSNMIDELLQFSRLGRADLNQRKVNLTEIIKEIIVQFKPDYTNRDITWDINDLPHVYGDAALLKIAFENLISNAIKYTSKKEHAVIEIGQKEDNSPAIVCIYIKDNGAGFDMAYKDKLFGVFQRLHKTEDYEGTGIGLANVKQIIKKHNGEIDAESEINKGAVFNVSLPKLRFME